MRKGTKVFIIVAAGLIVAGLVLAGVGWLMGGTGSLYFDGDRGFFGGREEGSARFSGHIQEEAENFDGFTNIDIEISLADIRFIEGDQYRVEYSYDKGYGKPSVGVENGTLQIKDKSTHWNIGFNGINWPKSSKGFYLNVYYPAGTQFDAVNVISALGDVKIDSLIANTLTVDLDLGTVDIDNVKANAANFDLDLGDLEAKNLETNQLNADLDLGSADLRGILAGDTEVSCDLGDIYVNTTLERGAYNFDIEVDLGDFKLDDNKQGTPYQMSTGADNTFEMDCSLGSIEIDFK